jgi:hypothetical protein
MTADTAKASDTRLHPTDLGKRIGRTDVQLPY